MEEEVRVILRDTVFDDPDGPDILAAMDAFVAETGGVCLDMPPRGPGRPVVSFEDTP